MTAEMAVVLGAIIAGVFSTVSCFVNNAYQAKKRDAEQDATMKDIDHKNEVTSIQIKNDFNASISEINAQIQQSIAILDCKFDELTKKVEKHNNIVERTYKLESDSALVDEKLKVINKRLLDLEKVGV